MAYVKTVWENEPSTNSPISADNLNNIENGIETNNISISNKNLLINGNFDIWQRGTTFSVSTSAKYTSDRWRVITFGGTVNISRENSMSDNGSQYMLGLDMNGATGAVVVEQRIENQNNLINNQKTAISFDVSADVILTADVVLRNETQGLNLESVQFDINTSNERKEVIFNGYSFNNNDVISVKFQGFSDNNATIKLGKVKYEIGENATKFVPKTYGSELRECKRYFERIQSTVFGLGFGVGSALSTTSCLVNINYEEKISIPTITTNSIGSFQLRGGGVQATGTGITSIEANTNRCNLSVSSSGLIVGDAYIFRNGNTTVYLDIDAEL